MNHDPIFRILDAAINRASEGLRVVEDYVRMVLDDAYLTEQLKQVRHRHVAAAQRLDSQELIAARDTTGDVGTQITTTGEYDRSDSQAVLQANMARVQQSLRTLEEYSKSISIAAAQEFEQLRYFTYQLEKAILTTQWSQNSLQSAVLYGLTDGAVDNAAFELRMKRWIAAGVDLIQLRDKQLTDRELLARGELLTRLCQNTTTRWIMNDRADLAAAARAHGVHLGQDDLPVREARRLLGPTKLIGVSTHCIDDARQAVMEGANYIGAGPTFASSTKSFGVFPGLTYLREVSQAIALPTFAIGGITLTNLDQVLAQGVTRVAVSAGLADSDEFELTVKGFREKLLLPATRSQK
jgi:thiamine-phosphate pyrophosphorylase